MPIEIRELIIKTEIVNSGMSQGTLSKDKQYEKIRKQLMAECKQIIATSLRRNDNKR
jgi:Family of unknown function (DUF5908)